ncbi:reverse transcriptase domain-containing protein [Tanacetum coccineum]
MITIFQDMLKTSMEVFMDDFLVAVRSFLGHARFYRRFIKDFSKISRSMTKLLEKDAVFDFNKECIEAFESLKEKLTNAPIMVSPDWARPFELMCNASDFAVEVVLGEGKHFRPILFARKTLNNAQQNYTVTEKELLVVVFAFDKFRSYLVLSKTVVFTDHSTLKYLFAKQDAKPRLIRWILLLQEFNIKIKNKKRAENVTADHLSCNPDLNIAGEKRFLQLHELDELRLQAYENSKLYKARTKAYHDKKLRIRKELKAGDKVLLYNSKYKFKAPKLRSKWYGPFVVKHGFPSGYVELYEKHGGSFTVNGHRVKIYHDEEQINELTTKEIHLMLEEGKMKAIPFMAPFPADYRKTMPWVAEKSFIYNVVENTFNEAKLCDLDETGEGIVKENYLYVKKDPSDDTGSTWSSSTIVMLGYLQRGRSGRQGDPRSSQFFLSLEVETDKLGVHLPYFSHCTVKPKVFFLVLLTIVSTQLIENFTMFCCLCAILLADEPWFSKRKFAEYFYHVGLGYVPRLTRVEWGVIRRCRVQFNQPKLGAEIIMVKNKIVREVMDFVKGHQLLFDQVLRQDVSDTDELAMEQMNLVVGILSKVSNNLTDYSAPAGQQQPTLSLLGFLLNSVTTALENAAEEKSLLLNKVISLLIFLQFCAFFVLN